MDEMSAMPYAMYSDLAVFLRTSGSTFSTTEATVLAVREWIERQRAAEAPLTGYQWKCLFLPSGTRLRMRCAAQLFYAEVVGDEIIFRGRDVSPRQMVLAIAGDTRNAWRDLWVCRPQDRQWAQADTLRRELNVQADQAGRTPPSPAEAIRLAASSMSQALQTALLLIDQSRLRAEQQVERRVSKHRRREDEMADDCAAD